MHILDKDSGEILAEKVEVMDSFWTRFRGLMCRRKFKKGEALFFKFPKPRKFRIHTFLVFFSIDLIYLGEDMEVLETKEGLSPWSAYSPDVEASYLIELPEGVIKEKDVKVGDELEILKQERP